MTPEELARQKIDKQLKNAGWDIVLRTDYISGYACAVKEALMQGKTNGLAPQSPRYKNYSTLISAKTPDYLWRN